MKTLYITDLDGTLLNADGVVSRESGRMLNQAIAAGTLFSVATARTPATVAPLLAEINISLPVIVMTGAAFWNPADGRYSDVRYISGEAVAALLDIYVKEDLPTYIYTLRNNHIDICHIGMLSPQEREFMALRRGTPFKTFHIPPEDILSEGTAPEEDVILLFAMEEKEGVERVYQRILDQKIDCNPLHYHDTYGPESELMEVFAPGATKGEALARMRRRLGVDRIVVFGDNINDIPMMREADWAVAVENAVDEVKEIADEIIGPNTSDAVARYILEASANQAVSDHPLE